MTGIRYFQKGHNCEYSHAKANSEISRSKPGLLSKSLERIAHHSVNLAEYGIYEMTGIDLRHKELLT